MFAIYIDPIADVLVVFSMYLFWASGYANFMWDSAKKNRWGFQRQRKMWMPDDYAIKEEKR